MKKRKNQQKPTIKIKPAQNTRTTHKTRGISGVLEGKADLIYSTQRVAQSNSNSMRTQSRKRGWVVVTIIGKYPSASVKPIVRNGQPTRDVVRKIFEEMT